MRLLEPVGPTRLRVAAAGDVGLIGSARIRARREGYHVALAPLATAFRSADLAFVNLEMPVGEPKWVRPGRSQEFWHDHEVVPALARAGVSVVSVANNHTMDCGARGLERTLKACAAAGLVAVGAGETLAIARSPARFRVRDLRVVVLAYGASEGDSADKGRAGIAPLEASVIRQDLARWRSEADVLVVSAHWGSMYVDYPPPRVVELARMMAEEGADLVLGHHPHVTQGYWRSGKTLIVFSLGDAAFNDRAGDFYPNLAADLRRETGVFTALIADEPGLEFLPFRLDEDGFPHPTDEPRTTAHSTRLKRISEGLLDGHERFYAESAPQLLEYALDMLGNYVRQGRIDRIVRLFGALRPRHVQLLWHAAIRQWRKS